MKPTSIIQRLVIMLITLMSALGANAQQAYACYTESDNTLTFYYDNNRSSRPGTTYDLNTGSNDTEWENAGVNENVTKVVFDPSFADARPTTTYSWFYNMQRLLTIEGMEYLNTSEVTNMAYMFTDCTQLRSLDLSAFNTSKVTGMSGMFSGCCMLTILDLSTFNTSKVTWMPHMFLDCTLLRTIYVGDGWSTTTVAASADMFTGSERLVGGKGTEYNSEYTDKKYARIDEGTSNPGYLTYINTLMAYANYTSSNTTLTFYYDDKRGSRPGTTYELNSDSNDTEWGEAGVNENVTKVVFDPSFAEARPTTTYCWFYSMYSLATIVGMEYLNTSEVTNMSYMFSYCENLTSLNLGSFNTAKVTNTLHMFEGCNILKSIFVGSGWSTASWTQSDYMFLDCYFLVGGQGTAFDANHIDKAYAHIDGGSSNPGYFRDINTGIVTGIDQVTSDKTQVQSNEWYTIDGQKLNGMPVKKGVYIQNGKKTINN